MVDSQEMRYGFAHHQTLSDDDDDDDRYKEKLAVGVHHITMK